MTQWAALSTADNGHGMMLVDWFSGTCLPLLDDNVQDVHVMPVQGNRRRSSQDQHENQSVVLPVRMETSSLVAGEMWFCEPNQPHSPRRENLILFM